MAKFTVGSRMRYYEGDLSWTGRIAVVDNDAVFMDLDEPIPFMYAPDNIVVTAIEKEDILDESWGLGSSLHAEMERLGFEIPSGSWQDAPPQFLYPRYPGMMPYKPSSHYFYKFNKPYPMRPILEMCHQKHRGQPLCWLQASVIKLLPIYRQGPHEGGWDII